MAKFIILQVKDCKQSYISSYQSGERTGECSMSFNRFKKNALVFTENEVNAAMKNLKAISRVFPMEGEYHAIEF